MPTVTIKGMRCQHCVKSTAEALAKIEGVSNVTVNLDAGEAHYDGTVDPAVIKQAIEQIGFEVAG